MDYIENIYSYVLNLYISDILKRFLKGLESIDSLTKNNSNIYRRSKMDKYVRKNRSIYLWGRSL